MDNIDRKILAELQRNGRISLTDLSEKIGISLSPCQRRVKALEDKNIIKGYQARLNPESVGLGFAALVFVTIRDCISENVEAFERDVALIPEVIQAQRLFGEVDYLLYIVTKDIHAYQHLYDTQLSRLPNVLRLNSTLVMKNVVLDRMLPL